MNSLLSLAFAFAVTAVAAPRPQLIDVKKALRLLPQSIRTAFTREIRPAPLSLFEAVLYEDRHGLTQLLEDGADPNALSDVGTTPLLEVAKRGSWFSAARLLVKHKADLNAVDADGNTVLHHAALFRDRTRKGLPRLTKLLIRNNVDLDIRNNAGESARDIAIKQEHWRVVGILAKYGVP